MRLRKKSVPFMGHLLTEYGLEADPEKVEAIVKMPTPTNMKFLKEFLGMVQYLSKFIPQLSEKTGPLRELERKDVEWCWLAVHDQAVDTLKRCICEATTLKYFDAKQEVALQSDADWATH